MASTAEALDRDAGLAAGAAADAEAAAAGEASNECAGVPRVFEARVGVALIRMSPALGERDAAAAATGASGELLGRAEAVAAAAAALRLEVADALACPCEEGDPPSDGDAIGAAALGDGCCVGGMRSWLDARGSGDACGCCPMPVCCDRKLRDMLGGAARRRRITGEEGRSREVGRESSLLHHDTRR